MGAVSKMAAIGAGLAVTQAFVAPAGRQQSTSMRGTVFRDEGGLWIWVCKGSSDKSLQTTKNIEFIELLDLFIHDLLRCWEYFLGYRWKRLKVCGLRWKSIFGHIRRRHPNHPNGQ